MYLEKSGIGQGNWWGLDSGRPVEQKEQRGCPTKTWCEGVTGGFEKFRPFPRGYAGSEQLEKKKPKESD